MPKERTYHALGGANPPGEGGPVRRSLPRRRAAHRAGSYPRCDLQPACDSGGQRRVSAPAGDVSQAGAPGPIPTEGDLGGRLSDPESTHSGGYIQQTNIGAWHQQVNNGARARETERGPTPLLEQLDGKRLDFGAARAAQMIHQWRPWEHSTGPKTPKGKGPVRPAGLQGWDHAKTQDPVTDAAGAATGA